MARSTSWVFMAFGSMGSMGGWPFAVPALRCARMTGLLFAKPKECHCELGSC